MTWQHPFVLAAIPFAICAAWWLFRRGAAARDSSRFPNIRQLWADRRGLRDGTRPVSRRLRGFAFALAAALALGALARPQWGEVPEVTIGQAREVMIALDLSRSMLATDVSPNRLARAKLLVEALLDQLHGERVGLAVFAGTAFVQSPLSADYEVLREFLAALDPSYLPQGGTDYTAMLRAAANGFGEQGDGDRYLVVLSDGEAHDESWQKVVPALRRRGIRVVGLGVGTPEGALVPDADGGALKDEQGNAVLSKLEPKTLQALAEQTGGTYRDAATWVDIADLVGTTVALGKKGEYVEERHLRLQDRFEWFLAPAVLLFLLSYWLEFPVFPLARALQTRGRRPLRASAPATAAVLVGLMVWHTPIQAITVAADKPPPLSVATKPQPPGGLPVDPSGDPSTEPAVDLAATVAALSEKPALGPTDYERLATDTIGFASQPSAPSGAPRHGIIDDALAAVDRGERQDASAADWPALRQQLEALRNPPQPPPPPQNDQQPPDKPCDKGGGGGGEQESEQQQSGGENSDDQKADQAKNSESNPEQNGEESKDQENGNQRSDKPETGDASQGGGGDGEQDAGAPQPPDPSDAARQEHEPGKANDEPRHGGAADAAPAEDAAAREDGADEQPEPDTATAQAAADEPRDEAPGAVERNDHVQALEAAGLDDERADEKPDQAAAAGAEEKPEAEAAPAAMRLVGGGQPQDLKQSDAAGGAALARLQQAKQNDSPAVLFERMNRADGQPPSAAPRKNW